MQGVGLQDGGDDHARLKDGLMAGLDMGIIS